MRMFVKPVNGVDVNPLITSDYGGPVYYDAHIAQYANVLSSDGSPLDGIPLSGVWDAQATAASPAYTTNVADSMILYFASGSDPGAGYTLNISGNVPRMNSVSALNAQIAMTELAKPVAGVQASGTWTRNSGSQVWHNHALALRGGVAIPIADFISTTISRNSPVTVEFSDISWNTPTSWLWDFGDGTTSIAQHSTHVYPSPGSYLVTLTATNGLGSNTKSSWVSIVGARNPMLAGRGAQALPTYPQLQGRSDAPYLANQSSQRVGAPTGKMDHQLQLATRAWPEPAETGVETEARPLVGQIWPRSGEL